MVPIRFLRSSTSLRAASIDCVRSCRYASNRICASLVLLSASSSLRLSAAVACFADDYSATRILAERPVTRITLTRGRRVVGYVRDARGQPIAQCTLHLRTDAWRGSGLAVTTDTHGRFGRW